MRPISDSAGDFRSQGGVIVGSDLLQFALSHAARGWRVFPLRPGDKRPAIRDWEARATTDPERIRRAWTGPKRFNIGIACGPSRLVVIDLDRPEHGAERPPRWNRPGIRDGADVLAALAEQNGQTAPFETYAVQTASGGEHLYFSAPHGAELRNSAGRLGWLVDIRAAGGYVVAEGSIVRGRRYRSNHADSVAALPDWITNRLCDDTTTRRTPVSARQDFTPLLDVVGRRSRYAVVALRGELDNVLGARPGSHQRNDTLNRAAFALGQLVGAGLLTEGLATAALAEASAVIGLPPAEAHATIRSGLTAGARTPRQLPTGGSR
ncbi:bifunctional DNA primase/polymerase [Pseudonocardia bannensis]|uniref:Bifunctional DNA primase/polymerase n=1 Tax=Pseudonocardia bannensis TaxID=630973 RepID=A0A848DGH7_9PSEU|nr:bifunctional DNA primase/polymerase [Pseudonocardia bannensis]NMH91649.1 bifunctional DNA primase/polymerase [Pseudonocardia bannensis]